MSLADTNTVGGLVLWLQSLPANLLLASSACTRGVDAARPLVRQRRKLTAVRVTSCSGGVCDRLFGHHMGARGGGAAEFQLQGGTALTAASAVFSLQGEHPDAEHAHSHVCIAAPWAEDGEPAGPSFIEKPISKKVWGEPQDEFKFYMEDASSKMLIVPGGGNKNAEEAAQKLGVPVASFSIPSGGFSTPRILHAPVQACACSCHKLLFCQHEPSVPWPTPCTPDSVCDPPSYQPMCIQTAGFGDGQLRGKSVGASIADPPARPTLEDPPRPDDTALFLHTSGTTSRPKGVPLSHGESRNESLL